MSSQLEILEPPPEPVYFCPGESSPVSQAVHRARQAAHWPGCRHCPGRDTPVADPTFDAVTHIRRTENGVRGIWQNAFTRQTAAQLMSVVTGHLQSEQDATPTETSDVQEPVAQHDQAESLTLVMGFDSRPSSPDIYAGVVSAALQNGCNVTDTGRTTVAQLQEVCRVTSDTCYGAIVTGAGFSQAFTGFDVFDQSGHSVAVPWQSWGIEVRRVPGSAAASPQPVEADGRGALERLKHSMGLDELSHYPGRTTTDCAADTLALLILPPQTAGSATRFRVSRRSGTCQTIDAEISYRRWLQNWFPQKLHSPPVCLCADPLIAERLFQLFETAGISADVMPTASSRPVEAQLTQRVRDTHAEWGFCVHEDDRFLTVANQYGQCLTAAQLSRWVNETVRHTRTHVTSHVPNGENRVVMLDAGRPHHAASHEVIADALALAGCIGQIITAGSALPRSA